VSLADGVVNTVESRFMGLKRLADVSVLASRGSDVV
jgi:hypothetical protein